MICHPEGFPNHMIKSIHLERENPSSDLIVLVINKRTNCDKYPMFMVRYIKYTWAFILKPNYENN